MDIAGPFSCFGKIGAGHSFVIAQLGQSLDGRIATPTGASRYINRFGALDHLHHLRARVDAVVVGIGTVLADDPMLNVRRVSGKNPARVVIDPNGRLLETPCCFAADCARRIIIRSDDASDALLSDGVEQIILPRHDGALPPQGIIAALRARGLNRLLIEGGAKTISGFLTAGCLDRLHVLVAPMIIGSGKTGLDLPPIDGLKDALRPLTYVHMLEGGDMLFDCDLRAQWELEAV